MDKIINFERRTISIIMCIVLIFCLVVVRPPKAKAVVTEGIFISLGVSLGLTLLSCGLHEAFETDGGKISLSLSNAYDNISSMNFSHFIANLGSQMGIWQDCDFLFNGSSGITNSTKLYTQSNNDYIIDLDEFYTLGANNTNLYNKAKTYYSFNSDDSADLLSSKSGLIPVPMYIRNNFMFSDSAYKQYFYNVVNSSNVHHFMQYSYNNHQYSVELVTDPIYDNVDLSKLKVTYNNKTNKLTLNSNSKYWFVIYDYTNGTSLTKSSLDIDCSLSNLKIYLRDDTSYRFLTPSNNTIFYLVDGDMSCSFNSFNGIHITSDVKNNDNSCIIGKDAKFNADGSVKSFGTINSKDINLTVTNQNGEIVSNTLGKDVLKSDDIVVAHGSHSTVTENTKAVTSQATTGAGVGAIVNTAVGVGTVVNTVDGVDVIELSPTVSDVIDGNVETSSFSPDLWVTNGLMNKFPFCIPRDVYNFFVAWNRNPECPHFKIKLKVPVVNKTFNIDFDLDVWNEIGRVCRLASAILFAFFLIFATRKLIWK